MAPDVKKNKFYGPALDSKRQWGARCLNAINDQL